MKSIFCFMIAMGASASSVAAASTSVSTADFASMENTLSVTAVGDVMLGTTFPFNIVPADGGRSLLKAASPYVQSADIRFGNYEGTLFEGRPQSDGKAPGPNRYLFRTPIDFVERLAEADFNVMSLANNHARDFGRAGVESTKSVLQLARIQQSSKDGEVAKFNIRGTSVALIATDFYQGRRSVTTPQSTYQEIRRLKSQHSVIIVSAHVGAEGRGATHIRQGNEIFMGENRGDSVSFARQAIDEGADLIIMHGPHVPRAMEVYRNRLIIYSLGNFATAQGIGVGGIAGIAPLVRLEISPEGEFRSGKIYSFEQKRAEGTILDPQRKAYRLMRTLSQQDFPASSPIFSDDGGFTAP